MNQKPPNIPKLQQTRDYNSSSNNWYRDTAFRIRRARFRLDLGFNCAS